MSELSGQNFETLKSKLKSQNSGRPVDSSSPPSLRSMEAKEVVEKPAAI